jgi:hypothetical protein
MENEIRHDPFGEDDFLGEVAAFTPKKSGRDTARPHEDAMEKIAQARGFENRTAVPKPMKEPLKPLQFRLPASEVQAFHRQAYEEFGLKHGAKTALFLKIWQAYRDSIA